MSLFNTTEGQFELPDGWVDRSISIFHPSHENGETGPSIVISRERLEGTVAEHSAKLLDGLRRALPRFELVWNKPAKVGPMDGFDLRFRWTKSGVRIEQRVVTLGYYDDLLVHTASGPLDRAEEISTILDNCLTSMKLRRQPG
jgi:hypothetical protein